MNEARERRIDIAIIQIVQGCARTCVVDLLGKLAPHESMASLRERRQELIDRTTSALLRIIVDELQATPGEREE